MVSAVFAAPPLKVLFLVNQLPYEEGDDKNNQVLHDALVAMGFDITPEAISATPVTDGYDLIVFSEAIGSGDAGWIGYQTAPIPFVSTKVWSIKKSALGWIDNENSGTSYGNLPDTVITIKDADHPIMTHYGDETTVKIGDNVGTSEANVCFVNITPVPGYTVVAIAGDDETHQAVVAIEPGTDLNGVVLQNRVSIVSWHQVFWDEVNEDGWKILEQACYWAAGRDVPTAVTDNFEVKTSIYPNPSTGIVNLQFSQKVTDMSVNVFSIDGKVVFSDNLSNTKDATIDLSEFNSGVYFIQTKEGNNTKTEKLILY
jgi:hypothetical protein